MKLGDLQYSNLYSDDMSPERKLMLTVLVTYLIDIRDSFEFIYKYKTSEKYSGIIPQSYIKKNVMLYSPEMYVEMAKKPYTRYLCDLADINHVAFYEGIEGFYNALRKQYER